MKVSIVSLAKPFHSTFIIILLQVTVLWNSEASLEKLEAQGRQ